MVKRIIKILRHPQILLLNIFVKFPWLLSDRSFLIYQFKVRMNKKLDLENPKTFSEKLQWLKLYNRRPEYTAMVDKADAKNIVSSIIGKKYTIPTIGIWDRFEDIDFDNLPNQFVLKTTHGSGGVIVCKNKNVLDMKSVRKELVYSLKHNYFPYGREYPYKKIKPRLIAEQFMVDESEIELKDYKFFCFDGEPKALFIASDRQEHNTSFDFFDLKFTHLPFTNGYKNSSNQLQKPQNLEQMIDVAKRLSKGIPHVRIDLYNINGEIYFGEFTFFHWGGTMPFVPENWDDKFGSWINLPSKIINN